MLREALDGMATPRPLPVLIEVGHDGGRGGCRDLEGVAAVRDAVLAVDGLALAGVAGYEGSVSHARDEDGLSAVAGYLRSVRLAMDLVLPHADPRLGEYVISAGGSLYFDVVAAELGGWPADRHVRLITRSGAYLTHDHGLYSGLSPLDGSAPDPAPGGRLVPAIEVWAPVLSRPEPGLALLGAGRRDLNWDQGLPVPIEARGLAARDAAGWTIDALNDQHAYLRLPPEAPLALRPGPAGYLAPLHGPRPLAHRRHRRRRRHGRLGGPLLLLTKDPLAPEKDGP
ncbi:hypothetical protein [Pseudonocardia nigra]|uniref:hypothetical protein n=1 Tax=Pseudonocardia nigra TaxID=1921578 RepID=UPI001C5D8F27|nr:hypothetical protein [Pseudonocardia nigra]